MRVQYTLPGYQPELKSLAKIEEAEARSFRTRMRWSHWDQPTNWKDSLGISHVPFDPASIGPPPRPASLNGRGLANERTGWRRLLAGQTFRLPNQVSDQHSEKFYSRMMLLLNRAQQASDAVTAQSLEGERR